MKSVCSCYSMTVCNSQCLILLIVRVWGSNNDCNHCFFLLYSTLCHYMINIKIYWPSSTNVQSLRHSVNQISSCTKGEYTVCCHLNEHSCLQLLSSTKISHTKSTLQTYLISRFICNKSTFINTCTCMQMFRNINKIIKWMSIMKDKEVK